MQRVLCSPAMADSDPSEAPANPWRDTVHRGLKSLHHAVPESVKRRIRPWYLRTFYYPWFPEVVEQPLLPPPAPQLAPFLAPRCDTRPTLLSLPITAWSHRHARPQQIPQRMARLGWRTVVVDPVLDGRPYQADAGGIDRWTTPRGPHVTELKLACAVARDPYRDELTPAEVERVVDAIADALLLLHIGEFVSWVQLPFWGPVAIALRDRFGAGLVYDWIDEHRGFANTTAASVAPEDRLIREADLVVTTAAALEEQAAPRARRTVRVPNGCDVEHFAAGEPAARLEALPRPLFGYVGAVADWFDPTLVAALARAYPDASIVLAGHADAECRAVLAPLANVHLLGEVENTLVPDLVAGFDVALIPFRENALTRATHPVKCFEYFAAGRPVASVPLPELAPYSHLVRTGSGEAGFVNACQQALADKASDSAPRLAAARANHWDERARAMDHAIRGSGPRASVIVVSHGQWRHTHACLERLLACLPPSASEVIVVDNGSTDGSRQGLFGWTRFDPRVRAIWNTDNRGFAAACNQGLAAARGDVLVLLNNDVLVTPGWLRGLMRHLEDPTVGMVGPVTNAIGNEARINVPYEDLAGLLAFARRRQRSHHGRSFSISLCAMFCVAMRRDTYERVGPLDERFGEGLFEDDDYARRLRAASLSCRCAEGVFVHHFGSITLRALGAKRWRTLFETNRRRFHAKWGEP